jgi:hypothetical protein
MAQSRVRGERSLSRNPGRNASGWSDHPSYNVANFAYFYQKARMVYWGLRGRRHEPTVYACVILRPNNFDPPVIFFPTLTRSKILTPSFSHTAVRCGSPTLRQVVSTWTCCGGRLAPRRANEGYTAEPLRALVSSAKPTTAIQVVRPVAPTASTRSLRMPTEQGHSALDSHKPTLVHGSSAAPGEVDPTTPTTVRQHKIDPPFIFDPHRQIRHCDLSCGSCDH